MAFRVGHIANPCDFTPHAVYSWNNRFDDPKREYRTLYCAETVSTCLREVLADFRPNAESITEFEELFGEDSSAEEPFGLVPAEWQEKHVIAEAAIVTDRKFATIEAAATLKILGEANASLLKELGHVKATPALLRSRDRRLTQAFSRTLFDQGDAGVVFSSRLDDGRCNALFEHRANLRQKGSVVPLTSRPKQFAAVCAEFGLTIEKH